MTEHTPQQDAKAVNPNYDTKSVKWTHNCQRCVVAYEMRRRGYDVRATARPTEVKNHIFFPNEIVPTGDDHLSHAPFDAWVPPESIHCENGQISIEQKLEEWGDGARAEVMVLWRGQHGAGHVFVAEQINGKTHFIDPQSGRDGVAYYFDDCDPAQIYICRTDDKELTEYVKDCCQ